MPPKKRIAQESVTEAIAPTDTTHDPIIVDEPPKKRVARKGEKKPVKSPTRLEVAAPIDAPAKPKRGQRKTVDTLSPPAPDVVAEKEVDKEVKRRVPRKAVASTIVIDPNVFAPPPPSAPKAKTTPGGDFTPNPMDVTVLVIGDPHFKTSNIIEMGEMVQATLALARQRRPTFIVCLGDVLDTHSKIDQLPERHATEWLHKLSLEAPLYVIVGNHDRMNDEDFMTTQHPFTAHKKWRNVTIVDQGAVVDIRGHRFVMAPYVYRGRLDECLEVIRARDCPDENDVDVMLSKTTAIFTHQEFLGAQMGAIVSKHGDRWSENRPLAINGHIHEHAWMQNNLVCVGTPLQHSASDGRDKSVSWFTVRPRPPRPTDTGIICPTTLVEERVELGVRKRIQIKTPASEFADARHNVDPHNTTFKWIVYGTRTELAAVRKLDKWVAWRPWIVEQIERDAPVLQPLPGDSGDHDLSTAAPFIQEFEAQVKLVPELVPVFEAIFC